MVVGPEHNRNNLHFKRYSIIISTMKTSVTSRIRITKNGKIVRRKMGQGHSQARLNSKQAMRRKTTDGLVLGSKIIKKLMYY